MIDKYLLDDLSRMSDEKGHLARWVIQLQIDLDVERRKAATLSISRDDMKYRAEAAEAALSAANEKLKGEQVPVAVIVLSKNWPDTGRKVIDYYIEKIQHLPVGTELFTAPKKLSDLPYDIVFNAIAKATNIQGQAISISVKEFKAAIKAASFTAEE